ncbi:MAG: helix-turn-helix domain-containing protein [Burkholderiales bacterium]
MFTSTSVRSNEVSGFGPMLRQWRKARGASQLDLALNCGLSQKHLSFLESGRSRPSRGMVLHLASALDVPLRQQNAMLLSAGFAPIYQERPLDAPDMRPIDQALDHALRRQEPYPAIVVDRAHNILRANRALGALMAFLVGVETAAAAAQLPMNAIELVLRPDGLKPLVENWAEVSAWLVRRLRAEAMIDGAGAQAAQLLSRVLELPEVAEVAQGSHTEQDLPPTLVLTLRKDQVRISLFSMIATIGTPLDVSLQNLRLELFFPADEITERWFAQAPKQD